MADNVAITAGTGTNIATDDIAGVHYQRVKLVNGTLDATDAIGGDATNGLDVDVTRVGGNVTVVQSTATNLLASVSQATAASLNATVVQGTAANLKTEVSQGTAASLNATVVQATAANLNAQVEGTIAHDSPVSTAKPVQVGAVTTASLVGETAVAADDITHLHATTDGRLLTHPYGSPENLVYGAITNTDGASTAVIAAGASGVITYLTTISIQNSSAAGVAVQIKDGTTVKAELWAPGGGGVVLTLPCPLRGTAATAWNVDAGAATTTIYATFVGYQSKV
jgi:hypothetical protein